MQNPKFSDVVSLLKNTKRTSGGITARCPSHDDQKNSLSVKETADGSLLFHCFAGCSYQDVVSSLGISFGGNGKLGEIEAIYDYRDETGTLLYQNVRFAGKEFRQRHFDKDGREFWDLNGVRRVPYRLPDLKKLSSLQDVVMTEGEKDADTLTKFGFPATNHKNWQSDFNYLLKGRNVLIFQDHDEPGVEQAEKMARMVCRDAKAIKIIDCFAEDPLPKKHGRDVSDFLENKDFDELRKIIEQTPLYNSSEKNETNDKSKGLNVQRLADVIEEEIKWLWKPYIAIGQFTIIEGIEGLGKSWTCCAMACAVADGEKLPFSESEPIEAGTVLMLSAEDSISHTVKPRLSTMNANLERIYAIDDVFSFGDDRDLIKFEAVVAEYEPSLIIIDPIFSYTGGKDLNQESSSRPIAQKLISIAQKFGCAVIGVRHIGKSKGNGDARAAGLGSISWRASARSVLMVGKDEETGEIGIVQTKSNLAEKSKTAIGFEIRNGQFYWCDKPSSLTAERMLSIPKDDEAKAENSQAVEFLREMLNEGEKSSKEIQKEAREAGVTEYALRKAKLVLGVKSVKKGGNFGGEKGWFLSLLEKEKADHKNEEGNDLDAEYADSSAVRHLQSNESIKTSYVKSLTEDVENAINQPIQQIKTTSSNGSVPHFRSNMVCECGAVGLMGEDCPKCGEKIIPF